MSWRILAGILLFAWVGQCLAAGAHALQLGSESPNLIGRLLGDGKLFRLSAEKARPKVINFFWVECAPCKAEMPELAKLERSYPAVRFISVHSRAERPDVVEQFVHSLAGAPATIVLATNSVQDTFRFMGLPHTIVLSKDNVVIASLSGYTPDNMQRLKLILDELSGTSAK